MHIQHEEKDGQGRFFIQEGGEDLAEMAYTRRGSSGIIILHTGVDESLEGKGVGKSLVAAAADWARAEQIKIVPVCSFAKKVMEHDPAYADVLG